MGWKAETETETSKPGEEYIEDFDPLTLNDDDIVIAPEEKDAVTEPGYIRDTDLPAVDVEKAESMVQGYRVQILATKDEQKAREEKRKAILNLSDKVYLIFESPYYRLRVGDCRTRKEAEELRDQIVRTGNKNESFMEWREAWIVRSNIYQSSGSTDLR